MVSANAALELDPANTEASTILASAQTAQARLKERTPPNQRNQRARNQEVVAATPTTPEPEPSAPAASEESVPQIAALRISFQSEREGVSNVRVHINGRSVMSENVGSKGGLLRRRGGSGGSAASTVEIPSGDTKIQVWVTPPGGSARLRTLSGNFLGASSHTLAIHLPETGDATVELR
jgi:hypothetical protein